MSTSSDKQDPEGRTELSEDVLTVKERRAIERLRKLAKKWPETLALFSNSGTLEVHKLPIGGSEPFTNNTFIEDVYGITNDGGDRDSF